VEQLLIIIIMSAAVNQANNILGLIIRRSFTYIDIPLMKQLIASPMGPRLEFGDVEWRTHLTRDSDLLEQVQHRVTRTVTGLAD